MSSVYEVINVKQLPVFIWVQSLTSADGIWISFGWPDAALWVTYTKNMNAMKIQLSQITIWMKQSYQSQNYLNWPPISERTEGKIETRWGTPFLWVWRSLFWSGDEHLQCTRTLWCTEDSAPDDNTVESLDDTGPAESFLGVDCGTVHISCVFFSDNNNKI